jgi:hypothetical protein
VENFSILWKVIENLGSTGLILWVIWKLADRWAGKFLEASVRQAEAMGELAAAVKDGAGDARETLLAMRVLAGKIDDMKRSVDHFSDERGLDAH